MTQRVTRITKTGGGAETIDYGYSTLSDADRLELESRFLEGFNYHPITAEKRTLVQRQTTSAKGDTMVATLTVGFGLEETVDSNDVTQLLKGVSGIENDRVGQKKTLQECNIKLEEYIKRSKDLEARNRDLVAELRALRESWGKETRRIRGIYDAQLAELRSKLENAENDKGILEVRLELIEAEIASKRTLVDDEIRKWMLIRENADREASKQLEYEAEIQLLLKKKEFLENEKEKLRKDILKLKEDIKKLRVELENESINHVRAENSAHCVKEELEFLKLIWEQEKTELEKLASRDSVAQSKEFWKAEIAQLFRELDEQFDLLLDQYRKQLVDQFNAKLDYLGKNKKQDDDKLNDLRKRVSILRTENERLKALILELEPRYSMLEVRVAELLRELDALKTEYDRQLAILTAELQAAKIEIERLLAEMRRLFDQKISLELEIQQYRKLLALEDARGGQVVVKVEKKAEREKSSHGEMTAKTRVDKNSKGNIEISEITLDARCITVLNSGTKSESLAGWKLTRVVDNRRIVNEFVFPANFTLAPGKQIKIWAKNFKPKDAQNDFEYDKPSWGLGMATNTTLADPNGEEKSSYNTTTNYETSGGGNYA